MESTPHQLGKIGIPWMIALNTGIAWSLGAFSAYGVSLYFSVGGIDSSLEPLFELDRVSNQNELAGFLCYSATFSFFLLITIYQVMRNRHTLRQPFPDPSALGISIVKAAMLVAPFWFGVEWAIGKYGNVLPGEACWLHKGALAAAASFYLSLLQSFMPLKSEEEDSEG